MAINELQYEHYIDSQPEEGDSKRFGWSLTANEKYLVVEDTRAGRVVIYHRSSKNKWVRFRTVSPPTNSSVPDATRYSLALAGDTLVIGVVNYKKASSGEDQEFYPYQPPSEDFFERDSNYNGAVYQTLVTSDARLERIDHPKPRELAGFFVAAHGNKIAFTVATYSDSDKSSKCIARFSTGYTTLIADGYRHNFPASGDIALNSKCLVVGNTISSITGGAINRKSKIFIFDLITFNPSPQIVEIPALEEMVVTNDFIIVSGQVRAMVSSSWFPKTLLVNINDLSITSLDGIGHISACRNLLFRCCTTSRDLETKGKAELFDISYTPPKLLSKSNPEAYRGFLSEDFLFAVVLNYSDVVSDDPDETFSNSGVSRVWIVSCLQTASLI
jgi:hypothetical protein